MFNKHQNKIFVAHIALLCLGAVSVLTFLVVVTVKAYAWAFILPEPSSATVHVPTAHADTTCLNALKGTPMANAIPAIARASAYYQVPPELFLGIAFAESSFQHFNCFNPWGIGNNGPRCYNSWEHGANGFAQLLRYSYLDQGLITAEQMVTTYVGHENKDWVRNVKTYYK